VCEEPMEPGPCLGAHARWYYNEETGECDSFLYGGCHGNRNRFTSQWDCEAACRHKRITLETTRRCKQPVAGAIIVVSAAAPEAEISAAVNETCFAAAAAVNDSNSALPTGAGVQARWAFDEKARRCRPFYFAGCGENENNFATVEECEESCPSAFPPELEVVAKVLNMEEGKETVLEIRVEGNPFPNVSWQHNSKMVELDPERLHLRADR
jgi:hypothetical protein